MFVPVLFGLNAQTMNAEASDWDVAFFLSLIGCVGGVGGTLGAAADPQLRLRPRLRAHDLERPRAHHEHGVPYRRRA